MTEFENVSPQGEASVGKISIPMAFDWIFRAEKPFNEDGSLNTSASVILAAINRIASFTDYENLVRRHNQEQPEDKSFSEQQLTNIFKAVLAVKEPDQE